MPGWFRSCRGRRACPDRLHLGKQPVTLRNDALSRVREAGASDEHDVTAADEAPPPGSFALTGFYFGQAAMIENSSTSASRWRQSTSSMPSTT